MNNHFLDVFGRFFCDFRYHLEIIYSIICLISWFKKILKKADFRENKILWPSRNNSENSEFLKSRTVRSIQWFLVNILAKKLRSLGVSVRHCHEKSWDDSGMYRVALEWAKLTTQPCYLFDIMGITGRTMISKRR